MTGRRFAIAVLIAALMLSPVLAALTRTPTAAAPATASCCDEGTVEPSDGGCCCCEVDENRSERPAPPCHRQDCPGGCECPTIGLALAKTFLTLPTIESGAPGDPETSLACAEPRLTPVEPHFKLLRPPRA